MGCGGHPKATLFRSLSQSFLSDNPHASLFSSKGGLPTIFCFCNKNYANDHMIVFPNILQTTVGVELIFFHCYLIFVLIFNASLYFLRLLTLFISKGLFDSVHNDIFYYHFSLIFSNKGK